MFQRFSQPTRSKSPVQKIRQALSGKKRGDQAALEHMRCVEKSTVSRWKKICDALDEIDGEVEISQLSHCQPAHLEEIARRCQRKEEIVELIESCEEEKLTVKQLRERLLNEHVTNGVSKPCQASDLDTLIGAGKTFGTTKPLHPVVVDHRGERSGPDA
jgi:hypothetical protein